jgi:hypothetical protein
VPPFSQRNFQLRFEFDEDMIDDPCRREMDVLLRCIRTEEHNEEPWGASLFRLRLKRKTELTVGGTWYGSMLNLSGQISPGIGLGNVSILLDFRNDEQPTWLSAPLQPGGGFDASLDTTDISHDDEVFVMARYRGTPVFAASTSPTVRIPRPPPAG